MLDRIPDDAIFPEWVFHPPNAALLTIADVKRVARGEKAIQVVEPQEYSRVTTLTHKNRIFENPNEKTGYFYGDKYAVSGRSADNWWIANDVLQRWLKRTNAKMAKLPIMQRRASPTRPVKQHVSLSTAISRSFAKL